MGRLISRLIIIFILLALLFIILVSLFIYFTQYKYEPIEQINIRNPQQQTLIPNTFYTVTTQNIKYGNMGVENHVDNKNILLSQHSSPNTIHTNINALIEQLLLLDSDFYTFQEVDLSAKRSYFINEDEAINKAFINHSSAFTYIYHSPYFPFPLSKPTGELSSGLLTLSKYATKSEKRIALPRSAAFIGKFFEPHYAILETTLPVRGQKQLVIANLQLTSSETNDDPLTKEQIIFLENYIESQLSKDHYLILAGDFNHMLTMSNIKSVEPKPSTFQKIPSITANQMQWAIDSSNPTTRSSVEPYTKDYTFICITDGFLISSNIEAISTATENTSFLYSSHEAVTLTFRLK